MESNGCPRLLRLLRIGLKSCLWLCACATVGVFIFIVAITHELLEPPSAAGLNWIAPSLPLPIQALWGSLYFIGYLCSGAGFDRFSLRVALEDWLEVHYVLPLPELDPASVPEIDASSLSLETLALATANYTRPAVIRGLAANTTAVRTWSTESFRETYGDEVVRVMNDGRYDSDLLVGGVQMSDMLLRHVLDDIAVGKKVYVNNYDRLLRDHPVLVQQLFDGKEHMSLGAASVLESYDPHTAQIFLGGLGTGSSLHGALDMNLFIEVAGRKKWTIFEPRATPFVRADLQWYTYCLCRLRADSAVAARLPRYEVVLHPGDALYNPPMFFHEVRNLDSFTVGCSSRSPTLVGSEATLARRLSLPARTLLGAGEDRPLNHRSHPLFTFLLDAFVYGGLVQLFAGVPPSQSFYYQIHASGKLRATDPFLKAAAVGRSVGSTLFDLWSPEAGFVVAQGAGTREVNTEFRSDVVSFNDVRIFVSKSGRLMIWCSERHEIDSGNDKDEDDMARPPRWLISDLPSKHSIDFLDYYSSAPVETCERGTPPLDTWFPVGRGAEPPPILRLGR